MCNGIFQKGLTYFDTIYSMKVFWGEKSISSLEKLVIWRIFSKSCNKILRNSSNIELDNSWFE